MSETVNQIVSAALRLLKVNQAGEAAGASEAEDGRIALNDLIEEFNLQPFMQPAQAQLTQLLTTSATYTFGAGGNNTTRPVAIFKAFIRDPSGTTDYPVQILSNEEYSDIMLKSSSSTYPYSLYYRNSYPQGVVTLFPTPTAGYTLYLECQAALPTYTNVADVVNLAPAYRKLYKYKLAIAISPEYKDPSQVVIAEAQSTMEWIKRMNAKDKPVMMSGARQAIGYGGGFLYGVP